MPLSHDQIFFENVVKNGGKLFLSVRIVAVLFQNIQNSFPFLPFEI